MKFSKQEKKVQKNGLKDLIQICWNLFIYENKYERGT